MMLALLLLIGNLLLDPFKSRSRLVAENLFLRQQLNIALRRTPPRPPLCGYDRVLLVLMTWVWPREDVSAQPCGRHCGDRARHPTAEWLARQIVEAFPWDTAPGYLVRDNDYAERLIGTLRRDCLDHVLIFGERHLRRTLTAYFSYYNETRTHLSLDKDTPISRAVQRCGIIVATPILSGLHHRYARI